jgi:hypothetical protein
MQNDFFVAQDQNFSKIHKTDKNFFWPKQTNTCLMILNDKPNCQDSRILMSPRSFFQIAQRMTQNPNLEVGGHEKLRIS